PVDWEMAALGSPMYDFAQLVDGFEEPVLEDLLRAYCDEGGLCGVSPPDGSGLRRILNCLWLHRSLTLLGKAVEEEFPKAGVTKLLKRAETFRDSIDRPNHP